MGICTPYVDSDIGRITVHTSSTRPTGVDVYAGKYIYESDTSRTLMYDGTGWVIMNEPTQSFTPAWPTGLTTTSGTNTGNYKRSDGWIDINVRFTFGASSAVTGSVSMTLPINAVSGVNPTQFSVAFYDSSAVLTYLGANATPNTTTLTLTTPQVNAAAASTTYVPEVTLSSTVPFGAAFASGDVIYVSGRYQMTTRYS